LYSDRGGPYNSRGETVDTEKIMRAYLTACLAIVVIGTGGYFFLDTMQTPSGIAFSTDAARINPQWSWRSVFLQAGTGPDATSEWVQACELRSTWQWIFVDLGTPHGEPAVCSVSQ
jgi:hypothetical protein